MNLLCPPADSETGEGLNPILEHLLYLPACAQLIYKLLPEHISYVMLQITTNDLDNLISQKITQIESYEEYITKYLLQGCFTEYDKELLKKLKLNDVNFLISLRKSFEYGPAFFSQVAKAANKQAEDQPEQLISIKQTFDVTCYDENSPEFALFNDKEMQQRFDHLADELLDMDPGQQARTALQQLLGIGMGLSGGGSVAQGGIDQSDRGLSRALLHFVLSDRAERAGQVLACFMRIYDSQNAYAAFGTAIKTAFLGRKDHRGEEVAQRSAKDLTTEKVWQACFLLQLINFPIGAIIELPGEFLGPFALMLFCFQELGLLQYVSRQDGEKLLIKMNPLFSIQQLPLRHIQTINQIRKVNLNEFQDTEMIESFKINNFYNKRKKTQLYVENTGVITCYGFGPETIVLSRFCDVKCQLDHCTIFQLSRDRMRSCGASATRIARYLNTHSAASGGVPPDIVNLLQSWEASSGQLIPSVQLYRFRIKGGTLEPAFRGLLYVLIADGLAGGEVLLFHDKKFVSRAQRCLGVARDVLINGDVIKFSRLKVEIARLNDFIQQERLEELFTVVAKAQERTFLTKVAEETEKFKEMMRKYRELKNQK